MNYELAKELKDAGFPQKYGETRPGRWIAPDGSRLGIIHSGQDARNACYLPTLSELIEACGEKVAVFHDGVMWTAGKMGTITTNGIMFFDAIFSKAVLAETPEEAVARLWLALNKRDA